MATTVNDQGDRSTLARRIEAAGGGGLPAKALRIAHAMESKVQKIKADRTISEEYRREQLIKVEDTAEAEMWTARDEDVSAAKSAATQRKRQVLSQLKSQFKTGPGELETSSEQAERHHREMRESVGLLPDIFAAQSEDDPQVLLDTLEEAIHGGQHARITKLGPVSVARLGQLNEAKVAGADTAWMSARTQLANYRKQRPTLNAQLKAADAEERTAAQPVEQSYRQAFEYFKIGAATKNGMRL
jgi:hypothetical protein